MLGVEVLGDPREQGRLGEAQHVAGGFGGPLEERRRRREQVGAIAEHAQLDEPLRGVVDNSVTSSGRTWTASRSP